MKWYEYEKQYNSKSDLWGSAKTAMLEPEFTEEKKIDKING